MAQYTTAQVAAKFETNTRTLRKFLRADAAANESTDSLPGKGARYAIEGKDLAALKKRFKAWSVADAQAKAQAEQSAQAGSQQAAHGQPAGGAAKDDGNVVDAEFTEVKDKKAG